MRSKQSYVMLTAAAIVAMTALVFILPAQAFAACTGDPHDRDAPTGNPHDDGEHGNPHDSGGRHGGERDNCNGAQ